MVEQNLGDAQKLIDSLKSTRRAKSLVTLVVILATLVALLVYGSLFLKHLKKFDMQVFQNEVQNRSTRVLPSIRLEVSRILEATAPVYQKAFFDEAKKTLPSLAQSIRNEFGQIANQVPSIVKRKIETRMVNISKELTEVLKKELPPEIGVKRCESIAEKVGKQFDASMNELISGRVQDLINNANEISKTLEFLQKQESEMGGKIDEKSLIHLYLKIMELE